MRFRYPRQQREAQERARAEVDALLDEAVAAKPEEAASTLTWGSPALREADRLSHLHEPAPEPPSCELHDWPAPEHRGNGKPRPPASLCPECGEAAATKYARLGDGSRAVEIPDPRDTPRLAAFTRKQEEKLAEAGVVRPGSLEEDEALDRIAELREAEQERARKKYGGYVATERIEYGQIVQYVSPGRGRGLVRRVLD